ncbi:3-hydroxyacyl-CoA dehydrogenase family protein [Neobacillus drentensis]|uniref:3-hydroxyacyl-CoA dehydrogenase family protein n=1 Tax=Neobacillus drentensis TaxID=220684 RepID=UPI000AD83649|nr:3-hydroxyacyl-CoA dehydrogenase NAD-binding domain-containing protein [Neobacillus drentensis]
MYPLSSKQCNEILVVGAGLMGAGIAQVFAQANIRVVLVDRTENDLSRGKNQIEKWLLSLSKKGDIEALRIQDIRERITFTTNLEEAKDVSLVIEAIPEKLELKKEMFKQLDKVINPNAILATNTSSLSVAAIGSVTNRPEKVIGMHFFSPVPIMKLLELVVSINTDNETIQFAREIGERIGKNTIIAKDFPGFTVNRVLVPMLNEAAFLVMEGNDPEEIDQGMLLGANHPVGPLRLSDYVGIDVLLFTLESLYEGFNDSKFRPCPLLKRMVEAGHLGKKTGKGFYSY